MRTKIISAFPGTGKTFYTKEHFLTTLDLDVMHYKWSWDKTFRYPNLEFPNNYIQAIKENIGEYKYILISTHIEVLDALFESCLYFYLVYPNLWDKSDYMKRYSQRESNSEFIEHIDKYWNKWIEKLQDISYNEDGCCGIELNSSDYLATFLDTEIC